MRKALSHLKLSLRLEPFLKNPIRAKLGIPARFANVYALAHRKALSPPRWATFFICFTWPSVVSAERLPRLCVLLRKCFTIVRRHRTSFLIGESFPVRAAEHNVRGDLVLGVILAKRILHSLPSTSVVHSPLCSTIFSYRGTNSIASNS